VIAQEEAVAIAMDTIDPDPAPVAVVTTARPGDEAAGASTTLGVVLESAELTTTDAPAITGGEEMVVWEVKLGGAPRGG
jgi:hypothetical protein